MRLDLFLKLNYESRTIILFTGIKYSMRDLLFDLSNQLSVPDPQSSDMHRMQ